jgi:hypothetical protein
MKQITAHVGRTSAPSAAAWLTGIALALALAAPACSTGTAVTAGGCSLNSDCATGLLCALGKCRPPCVKASDCPVAGSSCIDDGRNPVCETPTEKNTPCTREADCPVPLACASDYRCRNLCPSPADCNVLGITGRVCAQDKNGVDYCADPNEVTNGEITIAPPLGAPTSTPVVEPEGGTSGIVAALPQGAIIATDIGQAGGTVGADGVTVSIPAGALTSAVPITIQLSAAPGPDGTVSQVFEIGPTGTSFAKPVTIAFDYTDSELSGLPPSDFAVETPTADSGASWTPLSKILVDVDAHTIAGQTTHLSPYALVEQPVGFVAPTMGSMADSGACTNACDAGLTQCASGGVQTCQAQANGCAQWAPVATCGPHQTCTLTALDAGGGASCTCNASSCTQVGVVCQGTQTLATCATDVSGCLYASSTSTCTTPMSCSGMAPDAGCALTCTNSCTQGQLSCVSGGLATCTLGSNGCWAYGTPVACGAHQSCTGTAGTAACTCIPDPVCSAVGNTCANATTLATCSSDAQNCVFESATATCSSCSAGVCCTNSCTQGQTSCVPGGLAACSLGANGCWAYGAPAACGPHQSCTGAAGTTACTCNADPPCTAVGNTCASSTTLAACAMDSQGCIYESSTSTCSNGACSAGACCVNTCYPGVTPCPVGTVALVCTLQGNGCYVCQ